MAEPPRPIFSAEITREKLLDKIRTDPADKKRRFAGFYWIVTLAVFVWIWQIAAVRLHYALLLPTPWSAAQALGHAVTDPNILLALLITMRRVFIGFGVACLIGLPLGYLIGYSRTFLHFLDPIINSVRLIPIMAWVPLSIVWFGIGDGPTIFLIALAGIFPIILNAVAGVQEISPEYYNAAKSMGAGRMSIFRHVVIPASLPSILTGMRIGLGIGWMSVIWAEFIATQSGFGHEMVYAQTMLETNKVIALMLMAGIVGFGIDRGMLQLSRTVTRWKHAQ